MGNQKGIISSLGIGICPCHDGSVQYTTLISSGSPKDYSSGKNSARITSLGVSTCGHITIALQGSGTVFYEGKKSHDIGDCGQNCGQYVLVRAYNKVIVGN